MQKVVIIKQKAPPEERKWDEIFRFPAVMGLGIALSCLSIVCIGLQFAGIKYFTYFSTIGAGAWGGFLFLVTAALLISLYCQRLKRLLYVALGFTILSLVLSVSLLVLFAVGAANDGLLDDNSSWGCEFNHVVICESYSRNRETMVGIQVGLVVVQLLVLLLCVVVLFEFGRPFIPQCREVCQCCRVNETVVYTTHPAVRQEEVSSGIPPYIQQSSQVPIIIDIPKRGVIVNQQVAQEAPEIETVTNTRVPVNYTIDIPEEGADVKEPDLVRAVVGEEEAGGDPTSAEDTAAQEENKSFPVILIDGVPTVVDPDNNNEPLPISDELRRTVEETFKHVPGVRGAAALPNVQEEPVNEALPTADNTEGKSRKSYPVMLIKGVPTVVDPSNNNAPVKLSQEMQERIAESFQHRAASKKSSGSSKEDRDARFQRKIAGALQQIQQEYGGNDAFTIADPVMLDRR